MADQQQPPPPEIELTVFFRRHEFRLPSTTSSTLLQLGEQLRSLSGVAPHTMRLLTPPSRRAFSSSLLPFSDEHAHLTLEAAGLAENLVLRMMGSLPEELKEILGQEEERTIIGFSEEERRAKQRLELSNATSWKLPQGSYIFRDFKTLELSGIKLDPPPDRALSIMHKLASDPGIVSIMNKHKWSVGVMTEMAPLGYVGISPKCLLGFNKNHGEEISLRLRTDDLKGFRKYESIKKTLLHELAHMVYSEHDADFLAFESQLNKESVLLDWTKSKGRIWGGLKHHEKENLGDGVMKLNSSNNGYKVGGNVEAFKSSARGAAADAAIRRLGDASNRAEDGKHDTRDIVARGNDNEDMIHENDLEEPAEAMHENGYGENETVLNGAPSTCNLKTANHKETQLKQTNDIQRNTGTMKDEPDPDLAELPIDNCPSGNANQGATSTIEAASAFMHDERVNWSSDSDLRVIQEPGNLIYNRLMEAIAMLKEEATPTEAAASLQTLCVILRNVLEHPQEIKFKRLRKANPLFQSRVAKFRGALEVLRTVGFSEQPGGVLGDDCLILERNDPGLLWLARSSLETCLA